MPSLPDPFATLGVSRRFDVDLPALEKTHRELSRALHPDRFAQSGASERREALEKMANVNEAWRIVRDPIRRADALFRLAGAEASETKEPKTPPAFLMDIMEHREALADARAARDLAKVEKVGAAMAGRAKAVEAELAEIFASDAPDLSRISLLGELRFYARFREEVLAIQEEAEELSGASL